MTLGTVREYTIAVLRMRIQAFNRHVLKEGKVDLEFTSMGLSAKDSVLAFANQNDA